MKKYTYDDLLERLVCLKDLAIPPEEGEQSGCFSSYDRRSQYQPESGKYINWGANNDGDGYLSKQDDGIVVLEMNGPGVIWRAWSANPCSGHIRIFLDGSALPVVDMPFRDFFERYDADNTQLWPGNYPQLAPTLSRGKNRFIPISFQKGCKITLAEGWGAFYHFTYTKFASDTQVPTYSAALGCEHQMRLREIDRQLAMRGYLHHASEMMWNSISCEDGEDTLVYEDENPGALTCISVSANNPKELEHLILEMYWDGASSPSVSCPLLRFFSCIDESTPFRCLPISKSEKEYSSFWYMPYGRARIVVKNEQSSPIALSFGYHKESLSIKEAESMMRFCALTHGDDFEGLDISRFQKEGDRWPDWPVLRCKGWGRFCGMHLSVDDRWNESEGEVINWWWGEGDEKFFVDGEKFPSTFGTGSEDYIGYAWAAEPPHVLFDCAYACQNAVPIDGNGLTSVARYHIGDSVPFQHSFEAYIEKYKENNWDEGRAICVYEATAYWYMMPQNLHS